MDAGVDTDDIPDICLCLQIGVSVSPAEAQALFRRFGYDTVMPFEPFAHTLIMQPARQLAQDMPGAISLTVFLGSLIGQ